jgi:hypothetical protein
MFLTVLMVRLSSRISLYWQCASQAGNFLQNGLWGSGSEKRGRLGFVVSMSENPDMGHPPLYYYAGKEVVILVVRHEVEAGTEAKY